MGTEYFNSYEPLSSEEKKFGELIIKLLKNSEMREYFIETGKRRVLLYDSYKIVKEYEQVFRSII